jgi:hypothetical protein
MGNYMKFWTWLQSNGLLVAITGGIGYGIKLLSNLITRVAVVETKIDNLDKTQTEIKTKLDIFTSKVDQLIGHLSDRKSLVGKR